ncbi:preprotein translocase subunit SecY [Candidatus Blochmanniella vafra]|nr:preprotein translocase subunit SecY [Candidatus Blochmannia vafer]
MIDKNRAIFDFQSIKGGFYDLKRRVLFLIGALIIFRIGSFIPIPGVDLIVLSQILQEQQGTIIEMLNMFSGGSLSRASIFSLGIMPYISASIIIQLLTAVHPVLMEIKKEGESGRRVINQYIRYGTLILSTFQAVGIVIGLPNISGLVLNPGFTFYFIAVISLVSGTIFLMWLGDQITNRGVGNGISIIIFSGIVAGLPSAIGHTIEQVRQNELHFFILILIMCLIFSITFFVVFMEKGQRRILVHYAKPKRQQGRRIYAAQNSTHLPFKVNMAGVIPAIFASSVILFPSTIVSWFCSGSSNCYWLTMMSMYLQPGQLLYILIYSSAIIFFCFFYTSLVFNPRETADNLKKSGAFVPGIRPGEQTSKYIDKIIVRLTCIGAVYVTFICLVPEFMRIAIKVPFYFGGTSLLIVVVVIMDFMAQIQTLLMSSQYESVLKKANLKYYS